MLDQLVESKSNVKDGARRGKFLVLTFAVVGMVFSNGILWSLFAKDLGIGGEDLELSRLVAPLIPAAAPPAPEPPKTQPQVASKTDSLPSRPTNMARVDEPTLVPDKPSSEVVTEKARPIGNFKVSPNAPASDGSSSGVGPRDTGSTGPGIAVNNGGDKDISDVELPPGKKVEKPADEPKKVLPPKHVGVINGTAVSLPKPAYSAAAKAIRAAGDVNVQVTVDENGNVISASAISGHLMLKKASEDAARAAKFKPTFLNGQPVKVTGLIIYKFQMQ